MTKKTVFRLFLMSVMFFWVYPVMAGSILVDKDLFEKIYRRQMILEKKLEKLENADPGKKTSTDLTQEEFDEIADRLDMVETKSILDKVRVSGSLRTRYDNFNFEKIARLDAFGVPNLKDQYDGESTETWSNRLRLDLRSDVTTNIIFHGRLSYFKLWGDHNYDTDAEFDGDVHSASTSVSGDLHVERAYIDYFVPNTPISFTFGRLPGTGGPPTEYKDNTTRKSTWPMLMTSTEADGIIFNLDLDQLFHLKKGMFRITYNKNLQDYLKTMSEKEDRSDDTRSVTAAFEMMVPGVNNSLFWLSYVKVYDLRTVPEKLLPENLKILDKPRNSGDFDVSTAHLQFDNIFNTGIDWFGAYVHNEIVPNKEGTLIGMDFTGDRQTFTPVIELGLFSDSIKGNLGEFREGDAFYTGLRYTIPIQAINYPKIGVEFNRGSKYFMGGILISEGGEITNKLGIYGDAYEAYYIQPINQKHMYLRLGAIYIEHNYYNPNLFFGTQPKSDMTELNIYTLVDVRF